MPLTIIDRFVMSKDPAWQITKEEFNEAHKVLTPSTYLVANQSSFYLINRDYIRVKVVKAGNGESV